MLQLIGKIKPEAADGFTRLFLDFAADPAKGLPPYLSGVAAGREFWSGAAAGSDRARESSDSKTRRALLDEIASLSERLGSRRDILDKIRSPRGDALFVITGQQPGVFGGPLLTAYKVFTAVALARRIAETVSRPVVPLYWCGSDDTDFAEIRTVSLLTRSSTAISASSPPEAHGAGRAAGGIATAWLEGIWKSVKAFVAEFDEGDFAAGLIEGGFARARDHAEHASAILVGLAGGELAVVDGRSAAVRRHARPLIARYIAEEDSVKREVVERGKRLELSGYHAQLTVGEDSGIFLVEDGLRKNVTPDLRPALSEAAANSIERCSPGVIARNLVQDFALSPLAVVLGPAEIAYRAQMGSLYERFGIASPVPVPRFTGTFLPPELAAMLDEGSTAGVESLLSDPAGFARGVFERSLGGGLRGAARDFEREVSEAVDRLSQAVENGAPPKAAARIRGRLADLKNRAAQSASSISEAGRAVAIERWGFLADLGAVVSPGGKPQERSIASIVPFMFGGPGMREDLHAAASLYLDDLLDGRTNHIVYSFVK
jgi:hypothetical protein